ncbi:SLC13 family permease [Hahella sp. NBU794]|uniref:SLC13 family permease n=1 Tax=Hahella sp. NBU794 TaxID=3422590 RepID=UPI003D6DDD79
MFGELGLWLSALVVLSILVALAVTSLRPAMVFIFGLVTLYVFGLVDREKMLANFTNTSLASLALLLLCSVALEKTLLLPRIAGWIVGSTERSSLLKTIGVAGIVSSFANNTAVVSSLIAPLKNNNFISPSRLLIPLSYASILGGVLTLVGTSTNLIVDGFVREAGYPPLALLDFVWVGLPVFICGCACIVFLSVRSLPKNGMTKSALQSEYFLEYTVLPQSPLIGKTVSENGFRNLEQLFLVEIIRRGHLITPVTPSELIEPNDVLIFAGDISQVQLLSHFPGLEPFDDKQDLVERNLVEVVVTQSSQLKGKTLKEVNFRAMFDAGVVAIRRGDERLKGGLGKIRIFPGDALVLAVGDDFMNMPNLASNLLVVRGLRTNQKFSGLNSALIVLGFLGMLLGSAMGAYSLFDGALFLLLFYISMRFISLNELFRKLPIELILIIGAALGIAQAMTHSGLADVVATGIMSVFGGLGPWGALAGIYLATWLLTELITNNAAAALAFPIALAAAQSMNVDPKPFFMVVAYAASASFLSPYGYQTNLMVYSAGNYRFLDYIKAGAPVALVYGVMVVLLTPLFFPF